MEPVTGNIYRLIEHGCWSDDFDNTEGVEGQLVRYTGERDEDEELGYFEPLSRQEGQGNRFWLRFDQVEPID